MINEDGFRNTTQSFGVDRRDPLPRGIPVAITLENYGEDVIPFLRAFMRGLGRILSEAGGMSAHQLVCIVDEIPGNREAQLMLVFA